MDKITMIELFSGIGAQERAMRQLGLEYEVLHTCDCDKDAVLSYAAMRCDFEKELAEYEFPSQDKMIEELQAKNVGFDFQKGKHTITSRTPIEKLKQYYLADKLSKNLGDIGRVEKMAYADFWTYSYPCTDLSVAGKGEGMVNKCDKCEHSWPINFEKPEVNNICPNCGNIDIQSTRSGLLGQVQRLLTVSYEENTLPKYLLLENVKNLVGKKFKPQFDAWVNWLDLIGYNTYYQVSNAKHYGIPQNRERIFALSIRKDIDDGTFKFSETIPLTIRLKDILEKNVDEKYYLPDDRIEKILNSTFMQEKKRIQMTDVCDTLLARDWKDPKCVPVDGENINSAMTDDIKVIGNYMPSNHDASRVVDIEGVAPTVKENHGTVTAIAEPQVVKVGQVSSEGSQAGMVYSPDGLAPTLCAGCHGYAMGNIIEEQEPFIVASRGRNPENPSDRTSGAPTEQRLEPNFSGCTNTLTSVQKDNYVCEPQVLRAERTEYGKEIRKQYEAGEIDEKIGNMREMKPRTDGISNTITTVLKDNYVAEPIVYDDYNSRISSDQDAINTLTCNCGASAERNGVKIIEPIVCEERCDEGIRFFKGDCVGTLRTIDACGDKRVIEPELMIEDIVFPVMVRKYPVDCKLLCECLRNHKYMSDLSNKEIAKTLNIPLTKVEHWFRQDGCFAIPDADIWFKLKELLNITTDEFDESIMTFEVKDGVYDKANRCYHIEGVAPTLTAASANEKIIEPTIDLKCLNSKGGRNGVEGLQPSLTDRVYDSLGVATACATSTYFMPGYLVSEGIRWRIRKLTTKECWRLMGFSDLDHDRAAKWVSNSALYKQAGNSICTSCLISIFYSLFFKDNSSKYTQYLVDFND